MAAGSGTAPPHNQATALITQAAPEGWFWFGLDSPNPQDAHLRPDPSHPSHPYNDAIRRRPRLLKDLGADPQLAAFIVEAIPVAKADRDDQFAGGIFSAIKRASETLGPSDVPGWMKHVFLLREIFGAQEAALGDYEPVQISATPYGEFLMTFTSASQNEREAYGPLIDRAQTFFGLRRAVGGRPARRDDPVAAERSVTAAKLRYWPSPGWEYDAIADLFGWTGDQKARRERVRKAVREGEALLEEEFGKGWEDRPPPAFVGKGG